MSKRTLCHELYVYVQKIVILARNSAKKVISDKLELENDPSGFSENDVFSWENHFFTQGPFFCISMIAINRLLKSQLAVLTMKMTFFITKCSFQETGHLKMTHFYPLPMLKNLPDRKLFREPKITTGITRSNISSRWNKLIAITTWNSVTYIGHFHPNFWHLTQF